jgi:DNA-directed primase/polymerase protein
MYVLFFPQVCSQIAAQRAANPNLDKLYITKVSSSIGPAHELFMDTVDYTRNDYFHLTFSLKSVKKLFLVPSKRFKCNEMVRS